MKKQVTQLFANIWQQYIAVTPSANKVHHLLGAGDDLINDHVAYRTVNIEKVNLDKLAKHLIDLGYQECGAYKFEEKKLNAKHFEHPDATLPKVFISELLVEEFSEELQTIIKRIVAEIDTNAVNNNNLLYSGTHWDLSYDEYKTLLSESEYAAWFAAWGYRANHFTVSINHLNDFECIDTVNTAIKEGGFKLNNSGGEVKGNVDVFLEQSSTLADSIKVKFSDAEVEIPSCFYEFAKRHPMPCGNLYTGFVAASADKIFESTNN